MAAFATRRAFAVLLIGALALGLWIAYVASFARALAAWTLPGVRRRFARKYTGPRWRSEKERSDDGIDPVA